MLKTSEPTMDYTATERRIMALLSDGHAHTREELRGRLSDELGSPTNVAFHMCRLRIKLRPLGQTIVSERHEGTVYYRLSRFIANE